MFLTRTKVGKRSQRRQLTELSVLEKGKLSIEALALRCVWRVSLMLGPKRASNLAANLMTWLFSPKGHALRRIPRNLEVALRDQRYADINALTQEVASNLARVIAEYPHLKRIAGPDMADFIEFVADAPETAPTPERPPTLYIGVHQANWEILSSLGAPLGKPMTIVVSPLSNPFVHRLVREKRPESWVEQAERDQATRSLVRCLQSGRSVGLLADQRYENGQLVPFFGLDAMTAIGPARLAIKFGCDLVPTRIERIGPVRFRITTFAAVRPDKTIQGDQEQALDMMCRVNQLFEGWIKEKPGEWMCMKRRWPTAVYRDTPASPPGGAPVAVSQEAAAS